jgi:riboflavin synthase
MRLVIRTLSRDVGSVALEGASLTVNEVERETDIIQHTASVTSLGTTSAGDVVNIEVDTMAPYAARLSETR